MTEYRRYKRERRDSEPERKYKCNYCGKAFRKEKLYEHLKKWHKLLPKREKRTLRREYDRRREDRRRYDRR